MQLRKKDHSTSTTTTRPWVRPVPDGNVSFVEWAATFDCDRDRIAEWEEFFSREVFQGALNAVKENFA